MAEDSLRDLLERLTAVATGAANVHDKPSTIVEEVKDVLDHLARDELPAASAVAFAAVSPPPPPLPIPVCFANVRATSFFDAISVMRGALSFFSGSRCVKPTHFLFLPPFFLPLDLFFLFFLFLLWKHFGVVFFGSIFFQQ